MSAADAYCLPVKRISYMLNKSRKLRRIIRNYVAKEFPWALSQVHNVNG